MTSQYILVVDDEPDIRQLVSEILEDEGYEVKVAENAEEARILRRQRRPDLVLLDIWMPCPDIIITGQHKDPVFCHSFNKDIPS